MQFLKTLDGYINMSSIISLEIVAQDVISPDAVYTIEAVLTNKAYHRVEKYKSKKYARCALDMFMEEYGKYSDEEVYAIHSHISLEGLEKIGAIDAVEGESYDRNDK
ncbi:MAG: hypothetical protein V3G42_10470 [Oscillospiraceae bacterium]